MNGSSRLLLAAGALLALLGGGAALTVLRSKPATEHRAAPAPAKAAELPQRRIDDPIWPDHPAELREVPDHSFSGIAAPRGSSDAWVLARPPAALRGEDAAGDRGGVEPCNSPDPGFGAFAPWRSLGNGLFTLPERGVPAEDGGFDLVLHFHGHELARKEFVRADVPFALFGSSTGNYRNRLSGSQALSQIITLMEKVISDRAGRPAQARHVVVAAWSGGYEAVGVLLEQSSFKPDAVVLLDGLHFSRERAVAQRQLAPFLSYARAAAAGKAFMFVSHSSIDTDGFASSTESVHQLIAALGGRPVHVHRDDPLGLQLVEMFSMGSLHVRGYSGGGKPDHCAHLALYPMVLRAIQRRFSR